MNYHIPVLLNETLEILAPKNTERALDCTFGGGGHTRALLNSSECYVCGIDRDPEAKFRADSLKIQYGDRFDFLLGRFSQLSKLLKNSDKFDMIMFDFGISSFQIDTSERGFSFSKEAPLDMRMSKEGISAYDIVNFFSERDLANIIWTYGDERNARKIAAEVVEKRKISKVETTTQLSDIVKKVLGYSSIRKGHSKLDAATKTFQAIRIFVNDELKEINDALEYIPQILNNNARIATISFHALEDRIVKSWAKSKKNCFFQINKRVIKPNKNEIHENPRSRSAILRGFVYTEDNRERC
ncbi:MAG: 16S rRNA (cytosine(1402)-N(4))-methyltransferase RsmH [Holosporales bacterium]|jgi:16S rRNA (cytosine1402-N4)-methyltransferase|nr:16S rRNA (cytosine(1402)-N(4))-methyltransferase RsmH [Holosporales bacterium]